MKFNANFYHLSCTSTAQNAPASYGIFPLSLLIESIADLFKETPFLTQKQKQKNPRNQKQLLQKVKVFCFGEKKNVCV